MATGYSNEGLPSIEHDSKSHRLHGVSTGFAIAHALFPNPHRLPISNQKLERNVLTLPLRGSPFSPPLAGSSVSFPDAAALSPSAMNQPKPSERKQRRWRCRCYRPPHACCGGVVCGEGRSGLNLTRRFGLVWFGSANNCRLVSIQQRCGAVRCGSTLSCWSV
jgi:hypothetical protein